MRKYNKVIQLANFNITFNHDKEVMLDRFFDIIYPAFTSELVYGSKEKSDVEYFFKDVEIRNIDNECVLTGNIIKNTVMSRLTEFENGKLKNSPLDIDTAPYSRFLILLKNHRMLLIKNEAKSPSVSNFQKTVVDILKQYTNEYNSNIDDVEKMLPHANVNIIDIPSKENIEKAIRDIYKISYLNVRFFPLNNDVIVDPFLEEAYKALEETDSTSANSRFNSPKNKNRVIEMINNTAGLVELRVVGEDKDGKTITLEQDKYKSRVQYKFYDNITKLNDKEVLEIFKDEEALHKTSKENKKIYEKVKGKLMSLFKKD